MPALLRQARVAYAVSMRTALDAAGYDDIPRNGLYVIGGLAREAGAHPLSRLIDALQVSKQAAGQLVDTLVTRGYLAREVDGEDRRRLTVGLTERGRAAADLLAAAAATVDEALLAQVGANDVECARRTLAVLVDIGRKTMNKPTDNQTLGKPMTDISNTRESLNARKSDLTGSQFSDVKLSQTVFDNVDLKASSFTNVNLAGTRFVDVNLTGATIEDANLTGMTINGNLVTDMSRAVDKSSPQAPTPEFIRAFVPAKDFDVSKRFYQQLGFTIDRIFPDGTGGILSHGNSTFILQTFYVKEHAENTMMQLIVNDIDAWWRRLEAAQLPATFGVPAPKPPQMQPWGLVVSYVIDPSGVLWHIAQAPA